jgi:hypothetical protein
MCDYLNVLQETIEYEAAEVLEDTLNQKLAGDLADQIAEAVIEGERHGFRTIRYVLLDSETGQLESRMLYLSYAEAETACSEPQHGTKCFVGTLLCDC